MKILSGQNNFFYFENPFMVPFLFNFILIPGLNIYTINLLADLNRKFCDLDKEQITWKMIAATVDEYMDENPFILYFVSVVSY